MKEEGSRKKATSRRIKLPLVEEHQNFKLVGLETNIYARRKKGKFIVLTNN